MQKNHHSEFELLSTVPFEWVNKAKTTDYRETRRLFELDEEGRLETLRWTAWLRAPLRGSVEKMDRLWQAQRLAHELSESAVAGGL